IRRAAGRDRPPLTDGLSAVDPPGSDPWNLDGHLTPLLRGGIDTVEDDVGIEEGVAGDRRRPIVPDRLDELSHSVFHLDAAGRPFRLGRSDVLQVAVAAAANAQRRFRTERTDL